MLTQNTTLFTYLLSSYVITRSLQIEQPLDLVNAAPNDGYLMLLSPCIAFTGGAPQAFRPAPDIAVQLPFRTLSQNRQRALFSRDLNPRASYWLCPS